MSEHQAEQGRGEPGSVGAGSTDRQSDPLIEKVMASVREQTSVDAPAIAPDHETLPDDDTSKKPEKASQDEIVPTIERTEPEVEVEVSSPASNVQIMSPGDRPSEAEAPPAARRKRSFAAMAAVAALATMAGALGGALATSGLNHVTRVAATGSSGNGPLQAAIARIEADVVALKAGLEHTSKLGTSQFNKANDRIDRLEKAQAEPAAKLAKLSEAVEKLRVSASAVTTPVASGAAMATPAGPKEITGATTPAAVASATTAGPPPAWVAPATSVAPAASAAPAPAAQPKPEIARLPTVEGWRLRDVAHGGALIEGRNGIYEVYAGDPVPGLGRIDAIRKQDGRWVVVTSRGLIVSR